MKIKHPHILFITELLYSKSSVRPSVRPTVRPSVTLTNGGHVSWVTSKIITRIISLSVFAPRRPNVGDVVQGNTQKFGSNRGGSLFSAEYLQYL